MITSIIPVDVVFIAIKVQFGCYSGSPQRTEYDILFVRGEGCFSSSPLKIGIAAEFVYQYRLERIVLSGEHLLLHPDESSGIFHWGRVSEVGTILVFCAPLGVEQLQDMASLQQGLVG